MTMNPVMANFDDTVTDCAKTMKKCGVGSLLIKDGGKVVGIITEKDFVYKVLAKGLNPDDTLAADVMEKHLSTINPDRDMYDAIVEMKNNDIRRLPVEKDGKIVGLLTLNDILKIEPQLFELFADRLALREESTKPVKDFSMYDEGVCESCGEWSYRLKDYEGTRLCENCRPTN